MSHGVESPQALTSTLYTVSRSSHNHCDARNAWATMTCARLGSVLLVHAPPLTERQIPQPPQGLAQVPEGSCRV